MVSCIGGECSPHVGKRQAPILDAHSRLSFQSACVNRLSIVRLAVLRQGSANDGLHLDCARSANGFGF